MEDKKLTKALYDHLSPKIELGDLTQFENQLSSDDKFRRAIYDEASKDVDWGDYATFEKSVKKKEPSLLDYLEKGQSYIPGLPASAQPPKESLTPQQLSQSKKKDTGTYAGDILERIGAGTLDLATSGPKKTRFAQKLMSIPKEIAKKELSILGFSDETAEKIAGNIPFIKSPEIDMGLSLASTVWDKIEKTEGFKDIEQKAVDLRESSARYDKLFSEYLKNKQIGKALGIAILSGAESLPMTLEAAFGGPVGLADMGLYSASVQYDQISKNEDMNEVQKVSNALANGAMEILTEKIGSANYGKLLKSLYKTAGKEQAEQAVKAGIKNWLVPFWKKFGIYTAPVGEALEEGTNQLASNLTARITGEDKDRPIDYGVLDAMGGGLGGGAFFVGPGAFAQARAQYYESRLKEKEKLAKEKAKESGTTDKGTTTTEVGALEVPEAVRRQFEEDNLSMSKEELAEMEQAPQELEPKTEEESKDAERIRAQVEEGSQQPQGLEQGEENGLRVRDTSENGVEAVTGEEVTPQIYVAPYFNPNIESVQQARDIRETDEYKGYVDNIYNSAKELGVEIVDVFHNTGIWKGNAEPSNKVVIKGTIEQAEELASLLGATSPQVQEETYANKYVKPQSETHNVDEISISVDNLDKALEAVKEAGFDGATINETNNSIDFLDFSLGKDLDFDNKIVKFVELLKEKGVNYGKRNRKAVESRPLNRGRRKEVFERIKGDALRYGGGREGFRNLINEADRRDEEADIQRRGGQVGVQEPAQSSKNNELIGQKDTQVGLSSESGTPTPPKPPKVENIAEKPIGEGEIRAGFEKRGERGSINLRKDEIGQEIKKIIDANPHFYERLHRADALQQAQDLIMSFKSLDDAYNHLIQKTKQIEQLPIRHVARQVLLQKFGEDLRDANKAGDKVTSDAIADKVINLGDILQKEVRIGGQTSAMTMWTLLNPEATVFMVNRLFNDVNRAKLGFEAKQAEDFIQKWNDEVPQSVQRLLTENSELRDFIDKIQAKVGKGTKNARTTKAKAQELAAKVRALKSSNFGLTFADPVGVVAIMDGALEVTARTIETTGNILQAIQDGVNEIRKSKWYKGLTTVRQKEVEDKYRSGIRKDIDFDATEYIEGQSWYRKAEKEEPTKEEKEKKALAKERSQANERLKDHIYDVIASHWLVEKEGGGSLVDRLMSDVGLTRTEAERISKIAESAVQKDSQKVFEKTLGQKIPNKNTRESAFKKFYKLIQRGVLTNENYYEVFADKYKLKKGLSEEEKITLRKLAINAEQMAPFGLFGDIAQNEFLQYMAKVTESDSWVSRQGKLMVAANYARMLSGLTTHKVNLSSAGMNLLLRPFASALNINKWFKVIGNIFKGNMTEAHVQNPLADLFYAPGAYAIGAKMGLTEAMNIVKHGNVKQASKYMESVDNISGQNIPELEKNTFGVGKRFRPLEIKVGKLKIDLNPWNWMKYSGRTLLAEDATLMNMPFALEIALASREKAIREGKVGLGLRENKKLAQRIFDDIVGDNLSEEQATQVERQLEEQINMLKVNGIEPTPNQIRQRRFEITRTLLDLTQEESDELIQLARGDIFTDVRGGIFSQVGDALGHIFSRHIAIKMATMPKIPFTGVLGRAVDMTVDTAFPYGLIRAKGWSPTGILARIRQWERTGQFKDFFTEPAKAGLFKSAQLGETGSRRQERQMARAYLGLAGTLLAMAVFLRDDDKKDEDGNPWIDITGGLPFADYDKLAHHYMGSYTAKIGKFKFRYLNYPIMNMPLSLVGNYKDHIKAGVPADEINARMALLAHAWFHSLTMVKDTWLAKGINDMVELIGGLVNSFGKEGERETVKESDKIAVREIDPRVTKQLENMRDDYTGLVIKYVDPLKSNFIQQIIKFGTPEGRLKGTGVQLWMYNAGLQWWNDKRTDIFGQEVKVNPGDQGIAWPRADDTRWKKMWDYNVNLTDISPKEKIVIKGVPQPLEWDVYLERKKMANEVFKKRFDDYFDNLSPEDIQKKQETFTVDPRSTVKTNQIQEDLSKIWNDTRADVGKYLFVWDKYSKANKRMFDELLDGHAIPDFDRPDIEIDKNKIIVPFDKLLEYNDKAMGNFVQIADQFFASPQATREYIEAIKNKKTADEKDAPETTVFQYRMGEYWKKAKARPLKELKDSLKIELGNIK